MFTATTSMYCIFGKPVSHSMSPLVHNILFSQLGIDAVYLAFEIDDIKKGVESIRSLGIKGASITIPFKEDILEYLDSIDDMALQIGAVNTVLNRDGYLVGCNTDCSGAIEPLKETAGSVTGKHVCVIGAGGAARAVAFGMKKEGCRITIVNRSKGRGEELANLVKGRFLTLSSFNDLTDLSNSIDIIINTTSVGMVPDIDKSPVNPSVLNEKMTVMDIVYNPLKTKLLQDADNTGCKTVDGLAMFIHQGAAQFELFTGITPSRQLMREAVLEKMSGKR
ncbi:MAG: shikimate dehydrogenase [Desulfamplus sp.]|nr:shikimate dehydrogenase [Desulfamplus sp.]